MTYGVRFTAATPTAFLRIVSRGVINISGAATAVNQTPSFVDFHMLLDNTPSRGIGATAADIKRMIAATANNKEEASCAFACHIVSIDGTDDPNSDYNLTRKIAAEIRIDVVANAAAALIRTAGTKPSAASRYRMAAYSFGASAANTNLYVAAKPSSDVAAVAKATETITLMSTLRKNYKGDQLTSYDKALALIDKEIDTAGTGATGPDRPKILFLVGDSLGDSAKAVGRSQSFVDPLYGHPNRCIEPIDTKNCNKLKDRNDKIAVLYTTYFPLPENDFYMDRMAPFQDTIPKKMQECAGPGLYFEVSPTEGIDDAMKVLFEKIVSSPHITS